MEKKFSEKIVIKIDKDNNVGTISIRVDEFKVDVYKMSLDELKNFINNAYNKINE